MKIWLSVMIGFVLAMMFVTFVPSGQERRMNSLIQECQQELPRNETCKIIAIPDEESVK